MANNTGREPQADLQPRKLPTQERAKERVERILDATGALLDKVGVDALTTNLIAERAGVKVASLYQYFPNKHAVLAALAERLLADQTRHVEQFLGEAGFAGPWPEALDGMIDALYAGRLAQPGGVALRTALAAIPELAAVRQRDREELTDYLARALKAASARATDDRLQAVAGTMYTITVAILDQAVRSPDKSARELLNELKLVHRSYLARYLD